MTLNFTYNHTTFLEYLLVELPDERVKDWPLMPNPLWTAGILLSYLYFVTYLGPFLMKNRKPYELKLPLIFHNFFQVLASIYFLYESLDAAWLNHYSWKCQPMDYSYDPKSMRIARLCYWYFINKLVELFDTVFFVLRKKNNQISFLHVYHHLTVPAMMWAMCRYIPGGHETKLIPINSFVHLIMYTYYGFSAIGPQFQKYLWWKKHVTSIQIFQFCVGLTHSAMVFVYDCGYPKWIPICVSTPYGISFFYLFSDFYKKAYDGKNKKACQAINGKEFKKAVEEMSNGKIHAE